MMESTPVERRRVGAFRSPLLLVTQLLSLGVPRVGWSGTWIWLRWELFTVYAGLVPSVLDVTACGSQARFCAVVDRFGGARMMPRSRPHPKGVDDISRKEHHHTESRA